MLELIRRGEEGIMKFTKSYEPGEFEPQIYAEWERTGVFQPRIRQFAGNEEETQDCYALVMPPPNANGNLHIGHGLTVAIEDVLARYYRLKGKSTWYIPGADHAGFETWVVFERALEKEGKSRFDFSRDVLYRQVWDFVQMQRGNMELQVRALGASCAWDDLTFTLDENVVSRVYQTFEKMWNDGMVYRGKKLVNYCPKHQTAFADIEVDHETEAGKLWDIGYELVERSGEMAELIVSTTRPETIFGDTAVAVNPEDARYKDVVGKMVKLPLTGRVIPVVADEHADPEYGTGVVKITPAHDFDDFEVGERHGLPMIQVIGEDGHMTSEAGPEFAGLSTSEARKKVLEQLEEQNLLRGEHEIEHAVAHCYKCGTVIEPTLKEQWFIDVKRLARMAVERLEKGEIKFYPSNKRKVLINYLENLKDWNISRQIPWGIPIPMFQKETAGAEDASEWIFDTRTNLQKIEVGGVTYVRDEDTFDTWFSSSQWPIVCTDWLEGKENPYYPLNVMETAGDILFAWVARMIMMGVYVTKEVPFKEVYLHGLVLDEHGQKMSKSKGNVINPIEMVTKYGSDAFRLGILRGRSAGMNQAFSENSVVSGRNLCNKLWNVARFVQGMVDEAEGSGVVAKEIEIARESAEVVNAGQVNAGVEMPYSTDNMGEDWICRELTKCKEEIEDDIKEYRFSEAVETLYSTIWDKYADWFIESQKQYKNIPLLKVTLEMILKMLHPFAPFATEAIWQSLSWTDGMLVIQDWPTRLKFDSISAERFESLQDVVRETRRLLMDLKSANQGNKWGLLYGDDALVADNELLVIGLTKVNSISSCEGQPRGLRLALTNHEVYLDVPEEVVSKYRENIEERILKIGRELDALNLRLTNPNYVNKAPAHLVWQTREGVKEKTELIERLKKELEVIA